MTTLPLANGEALGLQWLRAEPEILERRKDRHHPPQNWIALRGSASALMVMPRPLQVSAGVGSLSTMGKAQLFFFSFSFSQKCGQKEKPAD